MSDEEHRTALVSSEDNRVLDAYSRFLFAQGDDVHTVSSGNQTLEMVRKHRYDLIIIDHPFEDMDLLELCLNLKEFVEPDTWILVSTGEDALADKLQKYCQVKHTGRHADVKSYLEKHYNSR
jgi:CheY-like chemotaxis protein